MFWKEKWSEMSWFRRIMLLWMAAMILGFGVATLIIGFARGIDYQDTFLRQEKEGDVCRYSGKLDDEEAVFTVHPDGRVAYRWGDYTYGPYLVKEDPAASPREGNWKGAPGVEIRQGGEILFRGGYLRSGEQFVLLDEDEDFFEPPVTFQVVSGGEVRDEHGRPIPPEELHRPSLSFLTGLVLDPALTHRGNVGLYLLMTLVAVFNVVQICFPEWFFRQSLRWTVQDPDEAEPSDYYIMMQRMEWIVVALICLVFYCQNLFAIQ